MGYAQKLLSDLDLSINIHESENDNNDEENDFLDETGFFNEEDEFGVVDKVEPPSKEGFAAASGALDQFASSSDGEDTDVDPSLFDSFPKAETGFEKDANSEIDIEEEIVDVNTIPAHNGENDQFEFPDEDEDLPSGNVSVEDLARDDDLTMESADFWGDLL